MEGEECAKRNLKRGNAKALVVCTCRDTLWALELELVAGPSSGVCTSASHIGSPQRWLHLGPSTVCCFKKLFWPCGLRTWWT